MPLTLKTVKFTNSPSHLNSYIMLTQLVEKFNEENEENKNPSPADIRAAINLLKTICIPHGITLNGEEQVKKRKSIFASMCYSVSSDSKFEDCARDLLNQLQELEKDKVEEKTSLQEQAIKTKVGEASGVAELDNYALNKIMHLQAELHDISTFMLKLEEFNSGNNSSIADIVSLKNIFPERWEDIQNDLFNLRNMMQEAKSKIDIPDGIVQEMAEILLKSKRPKNENEDDKAFVLRCIKEDAVATQDKLPGFEPHKIAANVGAIDKCNILEDLFNLDSAQKNGNEENRNIVKTVIEKQADYFAPIKKLSALIGEVDTGIAAVNKLLHDTEAKDYRVEFPLINMNLELIKIGYNNIGLLPTNKHEGLSLS